MRTCLHLIMNHCTVEVAEDIHLVTRFAGLAQLLAFIAIVLRPDKGGALCIHESQFSVLGTNPLRLTARIRHQLIIGTINILQALSFQRNDRFGIIVIKPLRFESSVIGLPIIQLADNRDVMTKMI